MEIIGRMPPYGIQHITMLLLITAVSAALLIWVRRTERQTVDRVLRIAGWVLLANSIFWILWGFTPWAWSLQESLPLHLSDFLRFVLPIALITQARWSVVLAFFWGLTLNLQSVLTPDLTYSLWPAMEFFQYWVAHGAGIVVPVVLTWGLGFRPTWKGYLFALASTYTWAAVAFTINAWTGANYGYLNRAPEGPSALDLMGPWPTYILWEVILVAIVWAVITLPFTVIDRRSKNPRADRLGLTRIKVYP